jgi:hypothetical protein
LTRLTNRDDAFKILRLVASLHQRTYYGRCTREIAGVLKGETWIGYNTSKNKGGKGMLLLLLCP